MNVSSLPTVSPAVLINGQFGQNAAAANNDQQASLNTPEKIQQVAEGFESMFLSLLLKEMRNTLDESGGGLFASDQSDTYGGMFDMFMSQALAESRQLGIADAVEKYLANKPIADSQSELPPTT